MTNEESEPTTMETSTQSMPTTTATTSSTTNTESSYKVFEKPNFQQYELFWSKINNFNFIKHGFTVDHSRHNFLLFKLLVADFRFIDDEQLFIVHSPLFATKSSKKQRSAACHMLIGGLFRAFSSTELLSWGRFFISLSQWRFRATKSAACDGESAMDLF